MKRFAGYILALSAITVIAACGGGGGSSTDTGTGTGTAYTGSTASAVITTSNGPTLATSSSSLLTMAQSISVANAVFLPASAPKSRSAAPRLTTSVPGSCGGSVSVDAGSSRVSMTAADYCEGTTSNNSKMNGSIVLTGTQANYTLTMNLTFSVTGGGVTTMAKMENYVTTFKVTSGAYEETISGKFCYGNSGCVTVATPVPLKGMVTITGVPGQPTSGELLMTGSDGGTVRIVYPLGTPTVTPSGGASTGTGANTGTGTGTATATGAINGAVKDAVGGTGVAGVTVALYASGAATATTSATTDASGGFTFTGIPAASGYSLTFTKTGYVTASAYGLTVPANGTVNAEALMFVVTSTATGTISGAIIDAVQASTAISGATVELFSGMSNATGTPVATGTTDSAGLYSFASLNAGNYTIRLTKSGYQTATFNVYCIGGQTVGNQNYTMAPVLAAAGETRIVLTWGATPNDLDSHLTGPIEGSTSRFHIYFGSKTYSSSGGVTYATLDRDDTTSYGPETTTISTQISGIYRYSVNNWSNMGSTTSTALANSGAVVKVYQSSGLVATFNVPNLAGSLWTVFELSGTTITPINTFSAVTGSSSVTKPVAGASSTDAAVITAQKGK